MSSSPTSNPNSDTGLASHIASGLAALVPPFTGIIFYFIEKKDSLARHWAVQSIFFGCTWFVLWIAYSILGVVFFLIPGTNGPYFFLAWVLESAGFICC